jgi:hypothetical protein
MTLLGLLTVEMYRRDAVLNSTVLSCSCGMSSIMLFVTGCSRADVFGSISAIPHVLRFRRNLTTELLVVCTCYNRLVFGTKENFSEF